MNKAAAKIRSYTAEDYYRFFLAAAMVSAFGVLLAGPLLLLFIKAFQDGEGAFVGISQFATYLSTANMRRSIFNTMEISLYSTALSVGLAFLFAYFLSRRNVPFKKGLQFLGMLPLFAPTMLLGMSLIYLFGNKGILTALGLVIPLYGKVGIVIAETVYCFPVAVMILTVAFSAADDRLYEAAEMMNTGSLRKMLTITLPSVKYGLINAIFVCFTYSFTDFGAPSVVGGNVNVLAADIYKQVIGQQNFNMGAVVGIFMMIPTMISFGVDRVTSQKQTGAISSKSVPYRIRANRKKDIPAAVFCLTLITALVLFFGVSLFGSLVKLWPYDLSLTLAHYDFKNVAAGAGLDALKNSILVSVATAVIGTCMAFAIAYLVEKVTIFPRLRRFLYLMSITPTAIPGTVIGLAYVLFFNPLSFEIPGTSLAVVNEFSVLYGTLLILVFVNVIHYFSVPFVTASTALKRLDKEFETVSESLKVPFYVTFMKITLPMSAQAVMEMVIYFFTNSMITVSAVIFLYTPATRLASVIILNIKGSGDDAVAAALCMVILGVNIAARGLYELMRGRLLKKNETWMKR